MEAGAKPGGRQASLRPFYADSVKAAERLGLQRALTIEGLDEEIAILRVRLTAAAGGHPEDLRPLDHGVQTLVRAVAAQYRLSPKARRDLADNIAAVLNSLGDQLLPADHVPGE